MGVRSTDKSSKGFGSSKILDQHTLQFYDTTRTGGGTNPPNITIYQISRSLRFNSADSAYLLRTPAGAGNRKTWTWSAWVKRSTLSSQGSLFSASTNNSATSDHNISFSNDNLSVQFYESSTTNASLVSTAVFRDPSSWYHIVVATDTTQATAANRIKMYVNGSEITSFSTATYPTQNYDSGFSSTGGHALGRNQGNASVYFNGYLTEVYFIDGQALTPSSFGETDAITSEWIPKAYSGTYGTNGFYVKFADNSGTTSTSLGVDSSPNSNNWTPNNFSVTAGSGNDSLVDTPTSYGTDTGVGGEVRGNYATANPLDQSGSNTFSNGNLDIAVAPDNNTPTTVACGSISVSSGKWYWEVTPTAMTSAGGMIGIGDFGISPASRSWRASGGWYYYGNSGQKYNSGSGVAYGATYANNDVIGIALDLEAGTVVFYKNGVSQGTAYNTGLTGKFIGPVLANGTGGGTQTYSVNFGQRPFAYTAPSGFKALCDTNLPAPTIVKPSTVMDVKLYTGNGTSQTISGMGFSPDFVWMKSRSQASSHIVQDTVRGTSNYLITESTAAEATGQTQAITAFNSDGFSLGSGTSINGNTQTYAAWCWDAGSSTVTNTAGTIQSSVRANASAGFSIVTYTGGATNSTVGHGLGAAPSLILCKCRSAAVTWVVYHRSLGKDSYLFLNTTDITQTTSNYWGTAGPNSTTFGVADAGFANNQASMLAYCFAPVAGYSAFGSYTGNGSADGPFVYTGFRPRWLLIKKSSGIDNWVILDTARDSYNASGLYLYPNRADAEGDARSGNAIDICSNGFKLRTGAEPNASTATYIYAAFAEFPFQYSRAR